MRRTVVVLVGCLLLMSAPAWAGGFSLFGTYGQTNEWNRSFGAGLRVSVGGERLVVDFTGTWFPAKNGVVVRESGVEIFDSLQLIPLEIGLRWVFSRGSSVRPYLGAGGGYHLISLGSGSVDDEWGYYGIAGLNFYGWEGGGFFVEAIYRKVEAKLEYGGAVYEEDLGGLGGTFGVTFKF